MNRKFLLLFIFDVLLAKKLRKYFEYIYNFKKNNSDMRANVLYGSHLWRSINKVINTDLNIFENKGKLPKNFGIGLSERIIEYPWVLASIPKGKGIHFDAGSTLNFSDILGHKKIKNKTVFIGNLNPESNCYWYNYISYIYEDLRSLPFRNEYFDSITLISVLEHIGLDNRVYTKNEQYNENKKNDYLIALDELKRILKRKGIILISVPYGKYQNLNWFQNFDNQMVQSIIKRVKPASYEITYYMYNKNGWQISNKEECSNCTYPKNYPNEDLCAGAHAVALIKMVK